MKTMRGAPRRRARFDRDAASFTLSRAKTYLGRLVAKAVRGEPVYIVRGRERFLLQHVPEIEPIPLRPAGYFAHCYTREEIQFDNRLGKASVLRAPTDLE